MQSLWRLPLATPSDLTQRTLLSYCPVLSIKSGASEVQSLSLRLSTHMAVTTGKRYIGHSGSVVGLGPCVRKVAGSNPL